MLRTGSIQQKQAFFSRIEMLHPCHPLLPEKTGVILNPSSPHNGHLSSVPKMAVVDRFHCTQVILFLETYNTGPLSKKYHLSGSVACQSM